MTYAIETGIPVPKSLVTVTKVYPADVPHILDRLCAGETLDSVSKDYGVTRERIRQILASKGGPDVVAAVKRARKSRPKRLVVPRYRSNCAQCDKEMKLTRRQVIAGKTFCSTKCYALSRENGRTAECYELRDQGLKWFEVGQRVGFKTDKPIGSHEWYCSIAAQATGHASRHAKRNNLPWPPPGAIDGHKQRVRGPNGKPLYPTMESMSQ